MVLVEVPELESMTCRQPICLRHDHDHVGNLMPTGHWVLGGFAFPCLPTFLHSGSLEAP